MSTQTITPISERKLEANRANARKSTGPKTQAGKDRSRMNGLVHGLAAQIACIPGENPDLYNAKRQAYSQFFQPTTQVELDLIDDLVQARWRMERYARYEAALLHATIEQNRDKAREAFNEPCPDVEAALAFRLLADTGKSLDLMKRYEGGVRSAFNAAWRQLAALKKGNPPIPCPFPEPDSYPTETVEPPAPPEPTEPTAVDSPRPPRPQSPQSLSGDLRTAPEPGYHSKKSSVPSPLRGPC